LSADVLATGAALQQRVREPVLSASSALFVARRSDDPVAQLLKPYPDYTTVSLYRNNVGTTIYQASTPSWNSVSLAGLSYLVSYTRLEAHGRCLVRCSTHRF
jgi:hypothetical protein